MFSFPHLELRTSSLNAASVGRIALPILEEQAKTAHRLS
jgi:hypothetical protein